jgi:hypothetical protein
MLLLPQAFRYLSSEVLPLFVGSKSPLGLSACLNSTKRVIWTLEEAARKVRQSFADLAHLAEMALRRVETNRIC